MKHFRWMIDELQQHGAQLCQDRIDMVLGKPTVILSADSAYQLPDSSENKLHESLDLPWWILQFFPQQYYDKDDAILQWRVPFGRPRSIPNHAIVHHSAERRLRNTTKGQEPYKPRNLKLSNLHPIHAPIPETTANISSCFIHKTPNGKGSVPDDPTFIRYAKLVFGWLFFALFWLLLAFVLVFLVGGCRIVAAHVFDFLNQFACIHRFFRFLHCWLIG
jgi:hypothetical protein